MASLRPLRATLALAALGSGCALIALVRLARRTASLGRRRRLLTDAVGDMPSQRAEQYAILRRIIAALSPTERDALVAHRGFHHACSDDDASRPLENTLDAYETAWASGVGACECDVALTSDGVLILCHDADLARVALPRVASRCAGLVAADALSADSAAAAAAASRARAAAERAAATAPLGALPLRDVIRLRLKVSDREMAVAHTDRLP